MKRKIVIALSVNVFYFLSCDHHGKGAKDPMKPTPFEGKQEAEINRSDLRSSGFVELSPTFGYYHSGRVAFQRFIFSNAFPFDIKIVGIQTSCGCIVSGIRNGVSVKAFSNFELKFKILPQGPRKNKLMARIFWAGVTGKIKGNLLIPFFRSTKVM